MADPERTESETLGLEAQLQQRPHAFDFFQAARALECQFREAPRFGTALRAMDDPVRFGQALTLGFAPSTLAAYSPGDGERPAKLSSYFLGMFGPNGALPYHLTEYADQRERHEHDDTLRAFMDLFHHRMLSLFYRAWAESNPTVSFDRPESAAFSRYLGSTFGCGTPAYVDRDAMPDLLKLHFSGALSLKNRNASGLRGMLAEFFQVPVVVKEFMGHWLHIPKADRCQLGDRGQQARLGCSVVIGDAVWDRQYKFRILAGPLTREAFDRLLPDGASLETLKAIVKNYTGDELEWDLQLILRRDQVPGTRLGSESRLGWTSWLGERQVEEDADDLCLQFA